MSETPTTLEPLLVRAKEAAELVGVSPRTWATMQSTGAIPPSIRLRGCVLWKRSDLELWVEAGCPKLERFIELAHAKKGGQRS